MKFFDKKIMHLLYHIKIVYTIFQVLFNCFYLLDKKKLKTLVCNTYITMCCRIKTHLLIKKYLFYIATNDYENIYGDLRI